MSPLTLRDHGPPRSGTMDARLAAHTCPTGHSVEPAQPAAQPVLAHAARPRRPPAPPARAARARRAAHAGPRMQGRPRTAAAHPVLAHARTVSPPTLGRP